MSGAAEGEGQSKSEPTEEFYAFVFFFSRSLKELINIFFPPIACIWMYGVIVKSPIGLQIPMLKPRDWFMVGPRHSDFDHFTWNLTAI